MHKIPLANNIANISTAVLVLCAVIVTASVIHREFGTQPQQFHIARHLSKWRYLTENRHVVGNAAAPIKIIEFVDYECPACRDLEPKLQKSLRAHPKRFALIRYDFPLPKLHPHAYKAAIAAECAARQDDFEKYRHALFKASFDKIDFAKLAGQYGVRNIDAFTACFEQGKTTERVDADRDVGERLGIRGTPTLVINGDVIPGTHSQAALDALLGNEYRKANNSGFWSSITHLFD